MSLIRPAAVASLFYSGDPSELSAEVNQYLAKATVHDMIPKALIVPHAGYIYSGLTAASAYNLLSRCKDKINRVVLIGPSHRVWIKGLAIPSSQFFETPLGKITIDPHALNQISRLPQVSFSDEAHAQEHSLEVQLPFLQTVLNQFTLIPIVVGEASVDQVTEVITLFNSDPNTLILISSDLSHFHDYQSANRIDNETTRLIENFNYAGLKHEMACGCVAIQGLLKVAKQNSMQVKTLAQCNSGDTAGDKNRVVGYASYAFF